MSRRSPFVVVLSREDRAVLEERAASRSVPHASVVRARIVLLAADGVQSIDIAARVGVCVDVVSRWRRRFSDEGVAEPPNTPTNFRAAPLATASAHSPRRWCCTRKRS